MNNSSDANWTIYVWAILVAMMSFLETKNILLEVWVLQIGQAEGEQIKCPAV
jgi:hypothetical protein